MAHLTKQLLHLKKDKALKKVIAKVGPIKATENSDLYFNLLRAIAGQQLSVKAAQTIWQRFLKLFKGGYPQPKLVLKLDVEKMRACGLSYQKAGYIKNIAQFSIDKSLNYEELKKMSDEALIEYLVEIKGVGKWTVEMILMFSLNRLDIFPLGDLGIQNGIIKLYKLKPKDKKHLFVLMEEVSSKWVPYRSLACKYIWRHKDDG